MFQTGRLIVKPQTAQLARNKDFLNKMDPYVVIILGGQTFCTQVARGQGKTPGWNDAATLNVNNDQMLVVRLFDKDRFGKDDIIGECVVPLQEVFQRGNVSNHYNLMDKGRAAGTVFLNMQFTPSNMGMQPGMVMQPGMGYGAQMPYYQPQPMMGGYPGGYYPYPY